MIAVDELPPIPVIQEPTGDVTVEVKDFVLDDEESTVFDYLDSRLEDRARAMKGDLFIEPMAKAEVSDRVMAVVKRTWESGGWMVNVLDVGDGYLAIFVRPKAMITTSKTVKASLAKREAATDEMNFIKEGIVRADATVRRQYPKMADTGLLIRMPTRGRPAQALDVLAKYRALAKSWVTIEVILDHDDESMNNSKVLNLLASLDCQVYIATHKSKIEAVNSGVANDWGTLVLASDDMMPVKEGYDLAIIEAMREHFPLYDGAIYFNDGYNKDHVREGQPVLCTLPIMGRHLWEQFGYVYYPQYGSLFSDDEQTQLLTAMNRLRFVDNVIIEHRHHAAGKAVFDALYQFNDDKWGAKDHELFQRRTKTRVQQECQWAFESPPMWLSLLICSTPKRHAMFARLERFLRTQMMTYPRQVELVVDFDENITIGEKRQRLLERAVGHYVAFIDDDDWVSDDYVARLVEGARTGADCASLEGIITTNGDNPRRFTHSINHGKWYTKDEIYYRTPNHLSMVKRTLALAVGFISQNVGEDHDFSKRLLPLLKTETNLGPTPLYYYWFNNTNSIQSK